MGRRGDQAKQRQAQRPLQEREITNAARLACRALPPKEDAAELRLRAGRVQGQACDSLLREATRLLIKSAKQERFTKKMQPLEQ
jgi:hypothetical protein